MLKVDCAVIHRGIVLGWDGTPAMSDFIGGRLLRGGLLAGGCPEMGIFPHRIAAGDYTDQCGKYDAD